jgi:hypothetical protein
LIDNGCHYKCVIPSKDLVDSQLDELDFESSLSINEQQPPSMSVQVDDASIQSRIIVAPENAVTSTPNASNQNQSTAQSSNVIEDIHKRQNYIFNKDLMNVLNTETKNTYDELNANRTSTTKEDYVVIKSVKKSSKDSPKAGSTPQQQQHHQQQYLNHVVAAAASQNADTSIDALNDSLQHKRVARTASRIQQDRRAFSEDHFGAGGQHHIETLDVFSIKEARDRIIVQEIDRMFTSIRDHQSACFKARGECAISSGGSNSMSGISGASARKAKYATWGYSSGKRHVKAKVMELPYAEDLSSLAQKVGIEKGLAGFMPEAINFEDDTAVEKVFVRIDDYLNQEVSHVLQRSYSAGYLNLSSGPRTRIKYVKIPSSMTKSAQNNMLSYYDYADMYMPPPPTSSTGVPGSATAQMPAGAGSATDFRVAPYDLRYWSILKLLEEERQNNNGQFITYFDDLYQNTGEWKNPDAIIKQVLSKFLYFQ